MNYLNLVPFGLRESDELLVDVADVPKGKRTCLAARTTDRDGELADSQPVGVSNDYRSKV